MIAWIPIATLPTKKGEYLCWMKDIREAPYYPDPDQWYELVNFNGKKFENNYHEDEITHWAELNEP